MKKKKLGWIIALLILGVPMVFIYLTFSNSTDCSQLVIDTYELHSGIDIPEVDAMNCYYDEKTNVRISVYKLNTTIDLRKFKLSRDSSSDQLLHGFDLLSELEQPDQAELYLARGEKWGREWTYVVDTKSQRLWAELKY